MITDKIALLQTANIVLASGSPRRQEILNNILKLGVDVVPSTFEENLDKSQFTPASYVEENARQKALEVWGRLRAAGKTPDLIIGSDTVVSQGEKILEKPRDEPHAVEMLKSLSGQTHKVYSGVALLYPPGAGQGEAPGQKCFTEVTDVTFAKLSDPVISAYVASGEPMDKAGGYGIQEVGGSFVSGINGDYFNVMGFPMHAFCRVLRELLDEGKVVAK